MGVVAAKARGEFELFLRQSVDGIIMRLDCAPEIERNNGVHTHRVFDDQNFVRDVVVLRQWESNRLKGKMPLFMRRGRRVHYTGTWESIPLAWAAKDLHETSKFPYIHDSTLPQHRLDGAAEGLTFPRPLQDDYPVWYFLTGPISRPIKLRSLLKLESEPYKRCAVVHGLTTLRHRQFEATVESDFHDEYAALGPSVGVAYLIKSKEAEDRLRYFKTDQFVVVRCKITLCPIHGSGQPRDIDGLTFVADPEYPLYHAMRNVPPSEMSRPPTSTEPSQPFEGYDYVRLEGAEEGHEPIDHNITSFVFPLLRDGRDCKANDVIQRRNMLKSSLRPRSPLVDTKSEFKTPSATSSRAEETRPRTPVPSGSHLRSSVPRAGVSTTIFGGGTLATTLWRNDLPTTSELAGTPLGALSPTTLLQTFARMRGAFGSGIVLDMEDFGHWETDDEGQPVPPTTSPTEPDNVRP